MQKLSNVLQAIIDDLARKSMVDAPTAWDKMSIFQRKKILQYLGEPSLDAKNSFYKLTVNQAGKVSKFIDQMVAQRN
jgi:hypothetical protein